MLKQKKLGLGVEDFKEIITFDYYYIDKTKFIEDILFDGAKIKLFCRPRRFGKTLNMSTLRYFFDIKNREENRKLFNDLYIENYTILNDEYSQYFGLLEDEVEKSLQDYGVSYKLDEVKSWYNGYKFGDFEVYNLLSILKFLKTKKLEAYWINTSGNTLIKKLLKNSEKMVFDTLNNLFNRKETVVYISQSIALGNNLSSDDLWELLLFSGYLTVKEKIDMNTYFVRIPNNEIMTFFKNLFVDIIFNGLGTISRLKVALLTKNLDEIISCLENLVLNAMSTYDTDKRYENPYQTLLAGFLHGLEGTYFSIPNFESEDGRPDIILKPILKNKPAYILELKRLKERTVEKELEEALNQIKINRYDTLLKREGITNITNIALVFDGKRVYHKIEK